MSNPVTSYNEYLKELESVSGQLADANGLRGRDSILRDSNDRPLALGGANTNAIAHALGSAYLAYDYSPIEAAALGYARELKSYWLSLDPPVAWDTPRIPRNLCRRSSVRSIGVELTWVGVGEAAIVRQTIRIPITHIAGNRWH